MQTFLDLAVREELAKYLAGERTLDDFRIWLAPITMGVEMADNPNAAELVHEIELVLAEFTSGHREETQLHDLLRPFVQDYAANLQLTAKGIEPASRPPAATASNVTVGEAGWWSGVGRSLVAAFG